MGEGEGRAGDGGLDPPPRREASKVRAAPKGPTTRWSTRWAGASRSHRPAPRAMRRERRRSPPRSKETASRGAPERAASPRRRRRCSRRGPPPRRLRETRLAQPRFDPGEAEVTNGADVSAAAAGRGVLGTPRRTPSSRGERFRHLVPSLWLETGPPRGTVTPAAIASAPARLGRSLEAALRLTHLHRCVRTMRRTRTAASASSATVWAAALCISSRGDRPTLSPSNGSTPGDTTHLYAMMPSDQRSAPVVDRPPDRAPAPAPCNGAMPSTAPVLVLDAEPLLAGPRLDLRDAAVEHLRDLVVVVRHVHVRKMFSRAEVAVDDPARVRSLQRAAGCTRMRAASCS